MDKINLHAVEIEINKRCNLSCSYCPNSKSSMPAEEHMDFENYKKIISELKLVEFKGRLSFHFYNEPLLSMMLESFIAYAKTNLKISIHLYTNGTLLTKERFENLRDAGVDLFVITHHEKVEKLPFESFRLALSEDDRRKIYYQGIEKVVLTNRAGALLLKNEKDEFKPLTRPCLIPSMALTISVNGDIISCYEDFHKTMIFGNILKESLLDLWNREDFKNFRERLKSGNRSEYLLCSKCDSRKTIPA